MNLIRQTEEDELLVSIEEVFELDTSELEKQLKRVQVALCLDSSNSSELKMIERTIQEELNERQSTDNLLSALYSMKSTYQPTPVEERHSFNEISTSIESFPKCQKRTTSLCQLPTLNTPKVDIEEESQMNERTKIEQATPLFIPPLKRILPNIVNKSSLYHITVRNYDPLPSPKRTKKRNVVATGSDISLVKTARHRRNGSSSDTLMKQRPHTTNDWLSRKHVKRKMYVARDREKLMLNSDISVDSWLAGEDTTDNDPTLHSTEGQLPDIVESNPENSISNHLSEFDLESVEGGRQQDILTEYISGVEDEPVFQDVQNNSGKISFPSELVAETSHPEEKDKLHSTYINSCNSCDRVQIIGYRDEMEKGSPTLSGTLSDVHKHEEIPEDPQRENNQFEHTNELPYPALVDFNNEVKVTYDPVNHEIMSLNNFVTSHVSPECKLPIQSDVVVDIKHDKKDRGALILMNNEQTNDLSCKENSTNDKDISFEGQLTIKERQNTLTKDVPVSIPVYADYSPFFPNLLSIMSRFFNHSQSCLGNAPQSQKGKWKKKTNFDARQSKQYVREMTFLVERWLKEAQDTTGESDTSKICRVQGRDEVTEILNSATSQFNSDREEHWMTTNSDIDCWNIFWSWSSQVKVDRTKLFVFQLFNHFPNAKQLTRKDLLNKHISRFQKMHGRIGYDIIPPSYVLPNDYVQFLEHFAAIQNEQQNDATHPNSELNIWIIKPVGMSRGRGITLMNDISRLNYNCNVVIQKYIEKPLLLRGGKKFDLRIYVLVTRFAPLEAFIYREGFARFASEKYTTKIEHLDNKFIHLTNTAIQDYFCDEIDRTMDTKCTLEDLKYLLDRCDIDFEILWDHIVKTVLKSLCIVEQSIVGSPNNSNISNPPLGLINSFELYGYDILFDQELKPWLIEVNASPSMECNIAIDHSVKIPLIRDTIHLLDPLYCNMNQLKDILQSMNGTSSSIITNKNINKHLHQIFNGKLPRAYGQLPSHMGMYERIAPSKSYDTLKRSTTV